MSIFSISKD